MTVRCIDIETTGTNPQKDAIVEVASVDLRATKHSTLVAPGYPCRQRGVPFTPLLDVDLVSAKSMSTSLREQIRTYCFSPHQKCGSAPPAYSW